VAKSARRAGLAPAGLSIWPQTIMGLEGTFG
jgi:hypothetical protein